MSGLFKKDDRARFSIELGANERSSSVLGFNLNRVKNDQSGVRVILEDLSEKDWSVHVGGRL